MQLEFSILPLPSQVSNGPNPRGALGAFLYNHDRPLYDEFFSPTASTGPSGLHDRPRPFVLRPHDLHIFDPALTARLTAHLQTRPQRVVWPLDPIPCERIRIHFKTPTELKQDGQVLRTPHFPALAARTRDRVLSLLSLYQPQPIALPEFAVEAIHETSREIQQEEAFRRSARNGNVHSLGGFTGWAEYAGPLSTLAPFLLAAQWTGVGRQTVWGKGQLEVEILSALP